MGGHAHEEVMDSFSKYDVIVTLLIIALLFIFGVFLLRVLKTQCVQYIQGDIQRKLESASTTAAHRTLDVKIV